MQWKVAPDLVAGEESHMRTFEMGNYDLNELQKELISMYKQGEKFRSWGKGVLWISAFALLLGAGYVVYILFSVFWEK